MSVSRQEAIRQAIKDSASLNSSFMTMNILSAVIASYGLLQDSIAVVIGAMIIAMLLGPITGIALALVDGDNRLLAMSGLAEGAGVAAVLLISLAIGRLSVDIPLGNAILSRTSPNIIDLAIALASGAAGAYAMTSVRVSASLVGVAISTALVPPLCVCGITLARGELSLALGGFLLFLANLVAIQLSSSVVLWVHGFRDITHLMKRSPRAMLLFHGPSTLLLIGLGVLLFINFQNSLGHRRYEIAVRNKLNRLLLSRPGANLADLRIDWQSKRTVVVAVVRTPYSYQPSGVASIARQLPRVKPPMELHVRSIITKEATPRGWVNQSSVLPAPAEPSVTAQ